MNYVIELAWAIIKFFGAVSLALLMILNVLLLLLLVVYLIREFLTGRLFEKEDKNVRRSTNQRDNGKGSL
jgi:hypothetical protein